MSPFLTIFALNAVLVALTYAALNPSRRPLTVRRLTIADAILTTVALGLAGLLFAGRGLTLEIGPISLRWWAVSLLSLIAIEAPVFWAFCKAYGLSLFPTRSDQYPSRRR